MRAGNIIISYLPAPGMIWLASDVVGVEICLLESSASTSSIISRKIRTNDVVKRLVPFIHNKKVQYDLNTNWYSTRFETLIN